MENQLEILDGLSRERYEALGTRLKGLNVLESDWRELLQWLMKVARNINYYGLNNKPDGHLAELWENHLFVVLVEIALFDTGKCKQEFLDNKGTSLQDKTLSELMDFVSDKIGRLKKYSDRLVLEHASAPGGKQEIVFLTDQILTELTQIGKEDKKLFRETAKDKLMFYNALHTVEMLRERSGEYIGRLENCGEVDPALAVLVIFLKNYSYLAAGFNARFQGLPAFYFKDILKSCLRSSRPDRTWVVPEKVPGVEPVLIPAQTRFVTAKEGEGPASFYLSQSPVTVTDIRFNSLYSVLLERRQEALPVGFAGTEDWVTGILCRQVAPSPSGEVVELFEPGTKSLSMGWMLSSPMLDLREGERKVTLELQLTEDSAKFLTAWLESLAGGAKPQLSGNKIFKDAFDIRFSGKEGWHGPISCQAECSKACDKMTLNFSLASSCPALHPCRQETHGMETPDPAVQVVLNPQANLYAYSWAIRVGFDKLTLKVAVEGVTSVKLYNESGECDPSVPFAPFGMQGRRGAYFMIGNYEIAHKPCRKLTLRGKWLQMPTHNNGFYGHYSGYGQSISNSSFQVQPEYWKDKRWNPYTKAYLFSGGSEAIRPDAALSVNLSVTMPAINVPEEDYVPGKVDSGFFRFVLTDPAMGFGFDEYRKVLMTTVINNAGRAGISLPSEPVVPLLSELTLSYEAEAVVSLTNPEGGESECFYHVRPLACMEAFPVSGQHPLVLVQKSGCDANLLWAFSEAAGCDCIRLYADVAVREDGLREQQEKKPSEIHWYYSDGVSWHLLSPEAVLQDFTGGFTTEGIIELLLPLPVPVEWLDNEGRFWMWAAVDGDYTQCRPVRGFYLNAIDVVADGGDGYSLPCGTISASEQPIPGIQSITQIVAGYGGYPAEREEQQAIHLGHRIAHRNRAVCPVDIERLVMEHFPVVEKVKCIPRTASEGSSIRVVVMSREQGGKYPLSSMVTIQEIEKRLSVLMPACARVMVSNPVYEKVRVHGKVRLHAAIPVGATLKRLRRKIDFYIAPWLFKEKMPDLDREFLAEGLHVILMNDEGIEKLWDFKVEVLTANGEYCEMGIGITAGKERSERAYGRVFVPADNHEIIRCDQEVE